MGDNRMSEIATPPAGATETEPKGAQPQSSDKLPDDHPLVKTLAANKAEIKELKAKAQRLDEIEEEQKTQAQKDAERVTKAEAEAATVPSRVAAGLKEHLAAYHQIDAEDAALFLTADEPELLLKQIGRLLEQSDKQSKSNYVSREGTNGRVKPSDMQQFLSEINGQSS